jgi:hypothetical protein
MASGMTVIVLVWLRLRLRPAVRKAVLANIVNIMIFIIYEYKYNLLHIKLVSAMSF